jgi:hypothetical protein
LVFRKDHARFAFKRACAARLTRLRAAAVHSGRTI